MQRIDDDFHPGYPLGVVSPADVLAMLNQMILNFSAFSGVAIENMTRGPGWQFLELGRRIERALDMIAPDAHHAVRRRPPASTPCSKHCWKSPTAR